MPGGASTCQRASCRCKSTLAVEGSRTGVRDWTFGGIERIGHYRQRGVDLRLVTDALVVNIPFPHIDTLFFATQFGTKGYSRTRLNPLGFAESLQATLRSPGDAISLLPARVSHLQQLSLVVLLVTLPTQSRPQSRSIPLQSARGSVLAALQVRWRIQAEHSLNTISISSRWIDRNYQPKCKVACT